MQKHSHRWYRWYRLSHDIHWTYRCYDCGEATTKPPRKKEEAV